MNDLAPFSPPRRRFTGDEIADIARNLAGVHYQRGGRMNAGMHGLDGLDCVGLVEVVAERIGEPVGIDPNWPVTGGDLRLAEIPIDKARVGDVLTFNMAGQGWAAFPWHMAILTEGSADEPRAKIIHAYWGHATTESWLAPFWRQYAIKAYRFNGRA